jgi:hypothetical protein
MIQQEKLLWTYDFIFVYEDGSTKKLRGRYKDNDEAFRSAHGFMRFGHYGSANECHIYSIVTRSKMLIAMLEPAIIDFEYEFEPVGVWKPVNERKING